MNLGSVARQLWSDLRRRRTFHAGVRILAYHGVVEAYRDKRVEESFHLLAEFREHVAMLRRCRVVSLAELPHALTERHLLPCVAITFDDGFKNNLLAAEILASASMPAAFFVATENVEHDEPIWPTRLRLLIAHGHRRVIDLDHSRFDLDHDPSAAKRLRDTFKHASSHERSVFWSELTSDDDELVQLESEFPSIAMMSWSDVRSLHANRMSIGSHGAWHELHHKQQPQAIRTSELGHSKAMIERELGVPCPWFAFPNGSFRCESATELAAAGYTAGFTMVSKAANRSSDRLLLPRLVPGGRTEKLASSLLFGS